MPRRRRLTARRPARAAPSATSRPPPLEPPVTSPPPPPHARWMRRAVVALMLFLVGSIGVGVWYVRNVYLQSEEHRFDVARREYKDGNYQSAQRVLDELL